MAFWNDVGNFFGGIFGGNKDDEERKRQQQQQAQRQAQQQSQQNQPQVGFTPAIRTLQDFTPQNNIPNQNQPSSLSSLVQNRPQPQLPKPQPKPAQPQPAQPQVQPNFNAQNRPLTMASTVNNRPQPVQQPVPERRSLLSQVDDFTAQANDAFLGGLVRGGANIVNSLATGFNGDETKKRTEDFMRSMHLSDNNGQSALAQGTDKNSTAGRLGQAVGQTEKLVAETVPTVLLPAGATLKATRGMATLPRLATSGVVDMGIGSAFGAGQAMSEGANADDILKNALLGGALGGGLGVGITASEPLLNKGLSALSRKYAHPLPVASAVRSGRSLESRVGKGLDSILESEPNAPIS